MKTARIIVIIALLLGSMAWAQDKNRLKEVQTKIEFNKDLDEDSKESLSRMLENILDEIQSIKEKKGNLEDLLKMVRQSNLDEETKSFLSKRLRRELQLFNNRYHKGEKFVIEIDFGDNGDGISEDILLPRKIRKGDYYRIVVNDINPNRYYINIDSEDSISGGELKFPTFSDISLETLEKLTKGFDKTIEKKLASVSEDSNINGLAFLASSNNKRDSIYKSSLDSINYYLKIFKKEKEFDPVKYYVEIRNKHKAILKGIKFLLTKDKRNVTLVKNKIIEFRNERYKEFPSPTKPLNYEIILDAIAELRKEFDDNRKRINGGKNELTKEVEEKLEFFNYLAKDAARKKQIEDLRNAYNEALTKNAEILELISDESVEKLLASVRFLHTGKNQFVSLPRQFKNDFEILNIDFVPKDSSWGLQKKSISDVVFPAQKLSYWSIGTSFYYSNLKSERFSTTSQVISPDTTATFRIAKEGDSGEELGISAMMRFGTKFRKLRELGIHGSLGPGVSIEKNIRPRLLFGVGISFGNKHNIVLDWGGILGYVDRKSAIIDEAESFTEKPKTTVTEIMIGNYWSLGYMFKL